MRKSMIAICAGLIFVVSAPESFAAGPKETACRLKCSKALTECKAYNEKKKLKVTDKKSRYCDGEKTECEKPCQAFWRTGE
jgi:hypothetical protein